MFLILVRISRDQPSKDFFGLVLRVESLGRVLVRQEIVPFVFCHVARNISLI